MVHPRAPVAGLIMHVGNHSFCATGITAYLNAGGTLESAQAMAAHESPRTTKLYDRTSDDSKRCSEAFLCFFNESSVFLMINSTLSLITTGILRRIARPTL